MINDFNSSVTAGARGERALRGAQRPAPNLTRRPRTESRPAPRKPRRVALATAALASVLALAAVLLAAAPVAAQTDVWTVWTATFTPATISSSFVGCDNSSDPVEYCSSATVLSDDDFNLSEGLAVGGRNRRIGA